MAGKNGTGEVAAVHESAQEFTEKSRLRSLFDARDKAADAIRDAPLREYEMKTQGRPGYNQVIDEHVRSAVTSYILECEPLFQNTDLGQDYWTDYDFSPVPLPRSPPESIRPNDGPLTSYSRASDFKSKQVLGVPDAMLDDQRHNVLLSGIRSYVELPSPIKIRWVGFPSTGFRGNDQTNTATTTTGIPRGLSENAFRATNKLLADLDIGLDAERIQEGEVAFDYSDLI